MHTWDLARATGQDERLDPDFCAHLLSGMEQMEEVLRSSGQYGPRVECPLTRTSRQGCWASSAGTRPGRGAESSGAQAAMGVRKIHLWPNGSRSMDCRAP